MDYPPEIVGIQNRAVSWSRDAETPVSYLFFHPSNVKVIQVSVRYRVNQRSGRVVETPDWVIVHHAMVSAYQDSRTPTPLTNVPCESDVGTVKVLNERVVRRLVEDVLNGISMYEFYMKDISRPQPVPIDRSMPTDNSTGLKTHGWRVPEYR